MTDHIATGAAIERVDVFVVSAPIEPPSGVSIGLASSHDYVLVKLTDRDGCVGWGESYLMPGLEHVVLALAEMVAGPTLGSIREHRRTLLLSRTSTYAQSAVLIALDDLRARQLGVPLHRLYGGPSRSQVLAYAASQGYVADLPPEQTWLPEVASYVDAGYQAIKLRVGRYPIDREAALLRRVREAVGDDLILLVDGNGAYTMDGAVRMGRALDELGFRWFEEPLPQWGYHGYPALRAALDIALAGGEVVETADEALRLLTASSFDVFQPEVVICGGVVGALQLAELAALHGVPVYPHTSGGALGIAATLQLLACVPDPNPSPACPPLLLEVGQGPNPWRTDLLASGWRVSDGVVTIPDRPGLGVEVDEDLVRARAALHLTAQP